jgi:serine/threonine protein kinase
MSPDSSTSLEALEKVGDGACGLLCRGRVCSGGQVLPALLWMSRDDWSGHEQLIANVRTVAASVLRLHAPTILPVLEVIQAGGRTVALLPDQAGCTLESVLSGNEPIPLSIGLEITRAVAEALYAVHTQERSIEEVSLGVCHRDVRPSSIFITTGGEVRLAGFGLQPWVTEHDDPLNRTFRAWANDYLAPEQRGGGEPHPAMDVYALGATLYEMIARKPFGPSSTRAVRHRMVLEDRLSGLASCGESVEIVRELRALVSEMLAFEANDRPTAAGVIHAVDELGKLLDGSERVSLAQFGATEIAQAASELRAVPVEYRNSIPLPTSLSGLTLRRLHRWSNDEPDVEESTSPMLASSSPEGATRARGRTRGRKKAGSPAESDRDRMRRRQSVLVLVLALVIAICGLLVADAFFHFLHVPALTQALMWGDHP